MIIKDLKEIICLTPITTGIWFIFITLGILFTYLFHFSWWTVPLWIFLVFAIHELLAFSIFNRGLFPSAERIARSYQWGRLFIDGYATADFTKIGDLTEGYFNGNFSKTIAQATNDKYDKIIELLNLKKGDWVLDVGCGLGDFLAYLKKNGIQGIGLNVSPDQQVICTNRGLDVRLCDFRNPLTKDLINKFDAVIFMGCLEHFVQAYANEKMFSKVFRNVFKSATQALRSESKVNKIFSTTIHINLNYKKNLIYYFYIYLLHGYYSGYYPNEGKLKDFCKPYFDPIYTYDSTIDYQFSSITCAGHFGNFTLKWTGKRLLYLLTEFIVNPFTLMFLGYHYSKAWMWQFGGLKVDTSKESPTKTIWYVYKRTHKF